MDATAKRILIVDDDASLLKLMANYLSRLGYGVTPCKSAEEAWERWQATPHDYSVALVDLNMPGMGGRELARRILRSNDSIRLIIVSGSAPALSGVDGVDSGRITTLLKPFAPGELARVVALQMPPT